MRAAAGKLRPEAGKTGRKGRKSLAEASTGAANEPDVERMQGLDRLQRGISTNC